MSKLRFARFATLPVLGAALTLACSESPTGTALDRPTPIQSSASAASRWVAKVSGGTVGFENGTGFPIPLGQKNDINALQIDAKLFGDGSASGSVKSKRQLIEPAFVPGLNEILIFHIIKSSVSCLEVDGNQAWVGIRIEKSASDLPSLGAGPNPFPPGTEAVQQLVLQPDGTVLGQVAAIPASVCKVKPDLSVGPGGFFRFDAGTLTITDRR